MATKEEISMVGFEIVAYAGDAQTDLLAALDAAREGDFEKAEQLHKDASDALIGAHDTQTKLLSQEAGGGEMEMTFIMAHAQDTLMTTMILEKQTRFTIDAYKLLQVAVKWGLNRGRRAQNNPYSTATHPEIVIEDVLKRLVVGGSLGASARPPVRFFDGWVYFHPQCRPE